MGNEPIVYVYYLPVFIRVYYLFYFFLKYINLDWGLLRIRVLLAMFGDSHVCKYFSDDVASFLLFYSAMKLIVSLVITIKGWHRSLFPYNHPILRWTAKREATHLVWRGESLFHFLKGECFFHFVIFFFFFWLNNV